MTHFLVQLNLKKFDRTRKKLIGQEKPSIGQENVSEQIEMGQDVRPIRGKKNTTKGLIGHFRTRRASPTREFSPRESCRNGVFNVLYCFLITSLNVLLRRGSD